MEKSIDDIIAEIAKLPDKSKENKLRLLAIERKLGIR